MRTRILIVGLFCLLPALNATFGQARGDDAPPTRQQIARWIDDLGADEFIAREDATRALITAGAPVVAPLSTALSEAGLEEATRGIYVLREIALGGDRDAEEVARAALSRLASGRSKSGGTMAAEMLARLDDIRQARVLDELQQLGATVQHLDRLQIGLHFAFDVTVVEIGPGFRGTAQDLQQLRWLGDVEVVKLEGEAITDEVVAQVADMKNLEWLSIKRAKIDGASLAAIVGLEKLTNVDVYYTPVGDQTVAHLQTLTNAEWLKLYGTKISKASAEKLQAALPTVRVDHRRGGFLGVGGQTHPLGCSVSIIHPGSAAQQADIRSGDVITKYEGQKVQDFETLTELIGSDEVGDTIKLEIWRQGEVFEKDLKLGEWE
ncbi:MAG: PDZ domain-containing protein [Pirellulaceae bacterium]